MAAGKNNPFCKGLFCGSILPLRHGSVVREDLYGAVLVALHEQPVIFGQL